MKHTLWLSTILFTIVVADPTSSSTSTDSIEAVEKKLLKSYDKLKSYTCKVKTVYNSNTIQTKYSGAIEWTRKDDKVLFRAESKGTEVRISGGQETKTEESENFVCDGEFLFRLWTNKGQTMAAKLRPTQSVGQWLACDPKKIIDRTVSHFKNNVKVMPDEMVDGKSCVVLEAMPPVADAVPAKMMMYFRKDLGINVRTVGFDKEGREEWSTSYFDFKINAKIKSDRFVIKVPEGVRVLDWTVDEPLGGD